MQQTKRAFGLFLLSLSFVVLHVTGCEKCEDIEYGDFPSNVLACQGGKLTVRSSPCFGSPDRCSYVAAGAKLTFTVAKERCISRFDETAESAGCAEGPVEFDCSGAPLAAGTYEFGSPDKLSTLDVASDGSCAQR